MTWQLGSVLVLCVALAIGFGWYERSHPPARVLALVAALGALAAIGRVAFAAFPNVKPTTDIVLFAGYALGEPAGFATGAVAALVSNVFLGQGPWTPWQMTAWGLVGVGGALVGRLLRGREPNRVFLAIVCGLAGFGFGAIMDLYQWSLAAEHTLGSYLAVSGTSLTFNIAHAAGNVVFAFLIGPAFIRALARYRRRFEVRWVPAPATAVVAVLVVLAVAVDAPRAQAADADLSPAIARAVHYLRFAQNSDGGFGAVRHGSSSPLYTGWTALGLAAAGRNPQELDQRRHSSIDYIKTHTRNLSDVGELERTLLVLRAAGLKPVLGGRNLVARLIARQRRDGSFDGTVNHAAFGVLALRAGGRSARSKEVRAATRWLLRSQNGDGGFGFSRRSASDVDDTGAVLEALAAGGHARSPVVTRAVRYLRRAQRADGGFGQLAAGQSNAQSTAWAIQGLVAAGREPRKVKRTRTPLQYLVSLQASDGSIRYSRTSAQTPVWVTAQALVALEQKAFPLRPAPRKRAHATRSVAPPSPAKAPPRHRRRAKAAHVHRVRHHHRRLSHVPVMHAAPSPKPVANTLSVRARRTAAQIHPPRSRGDASSAAWIAALVVLALVAGAAGIHRVRRAT